MIEQLILLQKMFMKIQTFIKIICLKFTLIFSKNYDYHRIKNGERSSEIWRMQEILNENFLYNNGPYNRLDSNATLQIKLKSYVNI